MCPRYTPDEATDRFHDALEAVLPPEILTQLDEYAARVEMDRATLVGAITALFFTPFRDARSLADANEEVLRLVVRQHRENASVQLHPAETIHGLNSFFQRHARPGHE